jgi:hypothetical protein
MVKTPIIPKAPIGPTTVSRDARVSEGGTTSTAMGRAHDDPGARGFLECSCSGAPGVALTNSFSRSLTALEILLRLEFRNPLRDLIFICRVSL